MRILFYAPDGSGDKWLAALSAELPEAECRVWHEGDHAPADYLLAWRPPAALLAGRTDLKALFNLGAGVDAILQLGDSLPQGVPVVRLDDAGMAVQMAEYVTHAVLGFTRRFDEHAAHRRAGEWRFLKPHERASCTVGVMGLGVLGSQVAAALLPFGFPVRGWSRSAKALPDVQCFAGADQLSTFLSGTKVLVCVLPLTADTTDILRHDTLRQLQQGAYLINVARGAHLVEQDLLDLIQSGHLAGARLDVFREEPLPAAHGFWQEPRISMTPHCAALTLRDDSVRQIAGKIRALVRGEAIVGVVDRRQGY